MIRPLLAAALLLAGCAAGALREESPAPSASAFALLGDAPYSQPHANLLEGMIDEINRERPSFVVHLGDITGGHGPCTDQWFVERQTQFARFASPFILVPGDNEWTDCHRSGYDPMERLARLRTLFHSAPLALPEFARQSADWPEHMRWTAEGTLFVTLNVPGSNNNLGRTPAMDAEHGARMQAVFAWLDHAVTLAGAPRFEALVVLMHANPHFDAADRRANLPDGYAALRAALEAGARRLGKPFVLAHGDTHRFKHDRPVADAPNFVRLEVDGWPQMGWLRVGWPRAGWLRLHATRGATGPMAVERLLWR